MPDRIVSMDGVEHHFPSDFSDAEIAQALHGGPSTPHDAGFLEGLKHTLPTPSNLMESLRAIPGNINHSLSPTALEDTMANFPNTPGGKLLHGRPMEGAGELVGGLGMLAATEGAGSYIRGRLIAKPPEMLNGYSVDEWKANGIGDQSLDVMRNGRPKPITGTLRMAPKTEPAPPTSGSSALQPEYQPVDSPVATPPPMSAPDGGITPTRQMELMQKFGGTAPEPMPSHSPTSQPMGTPRIMTLKETPTSWTPEAARARLEYNDWHSGAEPGSPEAKSAQATHRYEAETQNRYKYLLDSPNGAISPTLLAKMGGIPAKYALAGIASKQVGLPGWLGPALLGGADVVQKYPQGSMEALRAALLAQMTSRGSGAQR